MFWEHGEFDIKYLPDEFHLERERVPFVLILFALL